MDEPPWHYCGVEWACNNYCEYTTFNKNTMRAHMRVVHRIYYCMECRAQFRQCQVHEYKDHKKECVNIKMI
jgi:hypothetical protein